MRSFDTRCRFAFSLAPVVWKKRREGRTSSRFRRSTKSESDDLVFRMICKCDQKFEHTSFHMEGRTNAFFSYFLLKGITYYQRTSIFTSSYYAGNRVALHGYKAHMAVAWNVLAIGSLDGPRASFCANCYDRWEVYKVNVYFENKYEECSTNDSESTITHVLVCCYDCDDTCSVIAVAATDFVTYRRQWCRRGLGVRHSTGLPCASVPSGKGRKTNMAKCSGRYTGTMVPICAGNPGLVVRCANLTECHYGPNIFIHHGPFVVDSHYGTVVGNSSQHGPDGRCQS